jgi:hypothetical protein
MKLSRIVIYPKDVQAITGRSPRSCQRMIEKIKKILGKTREQFITYIEFCDYTGISREIVLKYLQQGFAH